MYAFKRCTHITDYDLKPEVPCVVGLSLVSWVTKSCDRGGKEEGKPHGLQMTQVERQIRSCHKNFGRYTKVTRRSKLLTLV